jgi:hypothetical protein
MTTKPHADIPASPATIAQARRGVRDLLLRSAAFRELPPETQRQIAHDTVVVASALAEPHGGFVPDVGGAASDTPARTLEGEAGPRGGQPSPGPAGRFAAQAAREGASVAGLLLQQVEFPTFVSGLINGVFHSIVDSSIKQMEAYGKLVADVAKTLNQFRDENVSAGEGMDHLVDQFPEAFVMELDSGGEGPPAARVRLREGADEDAAVRKVNESLPLDRPVNDLGDETIQERLVPAARTQLATSRQQLLATMVMMGINRIVVTDGRISAKVLYDFQARDNFRSQTSATKFEYDPTRQRTVWEGEHETDYQGGETTYSRDKEGWDYDQRDASYYTKGKYKYTAEPLLTTASVTQATTDAALQTRASLAGVVDVNFKSETFPLERLADSFQIGRIQDAARPGRAGTPAAAAAAATAPAATPA